MMNSKVLFRLVLFIVMVFGLSLSSCKKCLDCQYKYTDPETNEDKIYQYDEFCGNNEEVETFKQNAQEDARQFDAELTCTEETEWF